MPEEFSSEEAEVYADLAERAGVVARRILAERGLVYLDDLDPEEAREVLRAAWRCAAEDRFPSQDIAELHEEIDAMVESLIMTPARPEGVALH
nr:hypothetical protein [uncultured Brevundimonas sp.]